MGVWQVRPHQCTVDFHVFSFMKSLFSSKQAANLSTTSPLLSPRTLLCICKHL